ncbi:MAG TPA: dihydrolipoyl dehydrogenase [Gammaproteobacteria bacterium]|nr:dihydrolipoyl dehydrogenase [Gammaproteobacteria bacterium]
MSDVEVRVPDLGDFASVDVIEVHVKPGDPIDTEAPLLTLETDKASMDVPAPQAGTVVAVAVKVGAKVAAGDLILTLRPAAGGTAKRNAPQAKDAPATAAPAHPEPSAVPAARPAPSARAPASPSSASPPTQPAAASREATGAAPPGPRLVVIGAGPGGYTAAFRAADLGLEVTLVERWPTLGGVCLNVGCIPSKALLHAARVIEEAREMGAHGLAFGTPAVDTAKLRSWKSGVVRQLTNGLDTLAKQRKVKVIRGAARFASAKQLEIDRDGARETLEFDQCIIAAGSEPAMLPNLPSDPRIIDSTGALELAELPKRMLVIGGGIIGLEMATVYDALGVKVSVVELTRTLLPGCDRDLVKPLEKRIRARYEAIMLGTKVAKIEAGAAGITVHFEGDEAPKEPQVYGRVLVAVGRSPNGRRIAAERAGVEVNERGYIAVDKQQRTNVPHVFAIGDIVGQPMLAHKATHEGKVAAEVAAGLKSFFDARVVPAVAYTDPEVAWVGLTEDDAKARGVAYEKGSFPWVASARSLTLGRSDGLTKLLFDGTTKRLLGAGIVGTNAGDLIAEAALAIEMGADAEDVGLTIHPHPTLSETLAFSAEAAEGTITDLYVPKKRH